MLQPHLPCYRKRVASIEKEFRNPWDNARTFRPAIWMSSAWRKMAQEAETSEAADRPVGGASARIPRPRAEGIHVGSKRIQAPGVLWRRMATMGSARGSGRSPGPVPGGADRHRGTGTSPVASRMARLATRRRMAPRFAVWRRRYVRTRGHGSRPQTPRKALESGRKALLLPARSRMLDRPCATANHHGRRPCGSPAASLRPFRDLPEAGVSQC